jgi:putative membrane protein
MDKELILKRMAVCATLAMMFGAASAQTGAGNAAGAGTAAGTTATGRDASGAGNAPGAATGAAKSGSMLSSGDQKMMRDIAYSNLSEVAAGKLALERTQSADVKTFAQKMIDDHTKAQQELQTLADSKGVKLPTEPDAKHKALARVMSGLKGDAFDKRYLKQGGLNDHENKHKLLQRVEARAKDADLKAYAAKTITAVDQHLTLAQETAGKHGLGTPRANLSGAPADNGTMGSRTSGGTGTSGSVRSGGGAGAAATGGATTGGATTGGAGGTTR